MTSADTPFPEPRPHCYRCDKPAAVCICDAIPRVANRTEIVVLQHARERRHPVGTVRILLLGLERVRREVSWHEPPLDGDAELDLPLGTALLYPTEESADLAGLAPEDRPGRLLLLDGTWRQSRSLYRRHPGLADLPHVQVVPRRPSRYRIRKPPDPSCLSSVEAVVEALRILEPGLENLDGMLEAFEAMVDEQIARMPAEHRRKAGLD